MNLEIEFDKKQSHIMVNHKIAIVGLKIVIDFHISNLHMHFPSMLV